VKLALIVDDDPSIRDILSAILRRDGWTTQCAADGEEAIEHLKAKTYTVVVLDLMMPRIDGAGVLRFMKEQSIETPVIVVSAVSHEQELDPQIVRVRLQKPIEIGDLRAVLRAISVSASA
jgi:DNA-binding response OmpR family regulator